MYTDFYNLNAKPFQISSDPAFIWLGEKHKEALATLKYGVIDNKGLMLLTGDVGTGKTTLISTLLESLSSDVCYSFVPDPRLDLIDLLNYIAQGFHIDSGFDSKGSFLIHFGWFLEGVYKQNKKALLIIDEAQLLNQDLLEEIRLLSNIHRDGNHLLNIFFVGQNEFNEILHRPENRAVTQRITLNYQLNPLSELETGQYIEHRLRVAGASTSIFSPSAVNVISTYSEGIPRRINVICDHCLITGYITEKSIINAAIVEDCVKDIAIPNSNNISHPDKTNAQAQTPTELNRSPGKKVRTIVFLLFSVLVLSAIIGTVTSLYIKKPGNLFSVFQTAKNDQSRNSSPVAVVQQQENQSPPLQNDVPSDSVPPTKKSASILPDKEETILVADDPSPLKETNLNTSDTQIELTANVQTPVPHVQERKAPIKTDIDTSESPAEQAKKIKITENIEIRTNSDIQNQLEPFPSLPMPESQSLNQQGDFLEHSESKDVDSTLKLPEKSVVIRFERDSNDLSAANLDSLISLGLGIKNHPSISLNIFGYTDSSGPEQYNNLLSLTRATMIKSYLLGLGISPERMTIQGFGSQNPIADNTTREGQRLNRRVEIEVVLPNVQ